jgi:DNA-binding response OmpR family regulator
MNTTISAALHLNPATLQIGGALSWIDISDTECTLLKVLSRSQDQRLDSNSLLECVGKALDTSAKRALEVQIVRLRKKLELAGAKAPTIKAIRGVGYQLCIPISLHPQPHFA